MKTSVSLPCWLALVLAGWTPAVAPAAVSGDAAYQKPPDNILKVLHAPLPPTVVPNPAGDVLLQATPVRYPAIAELARPFLRLAGVRVTPQNRAIHAAPYWRDLTLVQVRDGRELRVAVPAGAKLRLPTWAADGRRFVFTIATESAVELWVGDPTTGRTRRIPGVQIDPVLGAAIQWMPDQKTLLVKLVPEQPGPPPVAATVPPGPNIQEAVGAKGAMSTYEVRDVLRTPHDDDLFEFYATSQLALIDADSGAITRLGRPALYADVSPAPGGQHLLVQTLHRPYSHLNTYSRFPREVDIWDTAGRVVYHVASLPLADRVPIWGVPVGRRDFSWRPTAPATLVWAEALDSGDWKVQVPHRDRLLMLSAPFDQPPRQITEVEQRFGGLNWSERTDVALLWEFDEIKHWERAYVLNVDAGTPPRLLWDRSYDEMYRHAGYPVTRTLANGARVMRQEGDFIHLTHRGASPEGDRPFLDKFNLATGQTERLFRSARDAYENFVAWSAVGPGKFLTRRESPTEPPNFHLRSQGERITAAPGEAEWTTRGEQITHYADPAPEARGVTKQLVRYKRADGLDLSFTLNLPPGYKPGTRLPTVVWAYPLDYTDPQMAGQTGGSAQRFTLLADYRLFLLDGYAIIENASMPVVGDQNKIYDTYMEQLVAGAKAAVDKAVEMGVTDRDRVGITGHSHGGLMTVNLLAHSDLFRAGIARSGAYNKSLTAFGFQSERRTLWEATDVYVKVSPLFHAHKIKAPLLIVHGEADANPGTTPIQSEKLYEAVRGNGGTVRLVMLPYESHGYTALESNEHLLYEALTWFNRYVKNAPPRAAAAESGN